ncbi:MULTISPECIES: hypothetical protein [Bacillus cereus group]|uniref:Phage protein n=1 Tax=Bacillus cereus TaxID=1396 RepID=A0AAW5L5T0_BACCE|nr:MULTISPECIES: hypothetical protein [Bacillus cereus group]MCQ6288998.1 hypothetical protein [Bacillus cereus]MCQ6318522.1 hypothetical protein [Bacillus cereus]MCQ6330158.1 hypothetical protein [Bacillus cereus]MCQ6386032.1 hypothetical protein [Bacillus cereus]MDM8364872.1 hypothetical protein [Bacillus thuringiensis]
MANNKLIIEVNADTTGALEGIKEVTEVTNECVESLEKVMNRLTNKKKQEDIKLVLTLGEKVVVKSIVENTADSIQGRVVKGSEINETR